MGEGKLYNEIISGVSEGISWMLNEGRKRKLLGQKEPSVQKHQIRNPLKKWSYKMKTIKFLIFNSVMRLKSDDEM